MDNHAFSTELPADIAASLALPPLTTDFDSLAIGTSTMATPPGLDDLPPSYGVEFSGKSWPVGSPPESPPQEDAMRIRGGGDSVMGEVNASNDYEDEDDEGEDEPEVELGVLKALSGEWDVDLGVGKAGGLPRWLDPSSPLSPNDVTCSKCSSIMSFLLQVSFSPILCLSPYSRFPCRTGQLSGFHSSARRGPIIVPLRLSTLLILQNLARANALSQPFLSPYSGVDGLAPPAW